MMGASQISLRSGEKLETDGATEEKFFSQDPQASPALVWFTCSRLEHPGISLPPDPKERN